MHWLTEDLLPFSSCYLVKVDQLVALAFVIVMDELNQLIKARESHGVRELLVTTHPGVGSAVVVGACQDLKDVSVAHRYQQLVLLWFQICWDRGEVVLALACVLQVDEYHLAFEEVELSKREANQDAEVAFDDCSQAVDAMNRPALVLASQCFAISLPLEDLDLNLDQSDSMAT